MSAVKVAQFLRQRAKISNLSHTEISKNAHISRQTWYRLINADISEAKLSTVVRVCRTLKVDPMEVLIIYFGKPDSS